MKEPNYDKRMLATVSTDTALFRVDEDALQICLVKMPDEFFGGCWALPGGIILENETADRASKRNVTRFTGITEAFHEQLQTFSSLDRDPRGRVVSIAYYSIVDKEASKNIQNTLGRHVYWFPVSTLPKLAYDHAEIIDTAIERVRSKMLYSDLVKNFMPEEFTLSALQTAYEAILDLPLDNRNFRARIKALNILEDTGKKSTGASYRPPVLYTFRNTTELDIWQTPSGPKSSAIKGVSQEKLQQKLKR